MSKAIEKMQISFEALDEVARKTHDLSPDVFAVDAFVVREDIDSDQHKELLGDTSLGPGDLIVDLYDPDHETHHFLCLAFRAYRTFLDVENPEDFQFVGGRVRSASNRRWVDITLRQPQMKVLKRAFYEIFFPVFRKREDGFDVNFNLLITIFLIYLIIHEILNASVL